MFRGAANCLSRIIQWNGGMAEWRNGGMAEGRNVRKYPKTRNAF